MAASSAASRAVSTINAASSSANTHPDARNRSTRTPSSTAGTEETDTEPLRTTRLPQSAVNADQSRRERPTCLGNRSHLLQSVSATKSAYPNAFTPVSSADTVHSRAAEVGSIAYGRTPGLSSVDTSAMSQSSQNTPPIPASCGEVAAQTWVAAPCSGVLKPVPTGFPSLSIQP